MKGCMYSWIFPSLSVRFEPNSLIAVNVMVHTRMVIRLINTPSVPAGMRFSILQGLLRFKEEFKTKD